MSKLAFIFPGQGAQKAGMGKDFYENSEAARSFFDQAQKILDFDLKEMCFGEHEELNLTEYTQPCMVSVCLAIVQELKKRGINPDITAGLSLGEYAAVAAAGGMNELDAIKLVRRRGILMQSTVPAGEGAMAAVLGLDAKKIEEILESFENVWIANYNCPGQLVITGEKSAVETAGSSLKEAGTKRVILLNVSGPFHSPMMETAGQQLARVLENVRLNQPVIPYVSNVTADFVGETGEIKDLLIRQVSSPVRWQQSVEKLIAAGVDTFVEIGPGKTLSGFIRRIDRNVKCFNVGTWEEAEKAAEQLC